MPEGYETAFGKGNEEAERRPRGLASLKILLLAAIVAATVVVVRRSRQDPHRERLACINNLLQINSAKANWAKEERKGVGAVPSDLEIYGSPEVRGYMKYPPKCPSGGKYVVGAIGTDPMCSLAGKGHAIGAYGARAGYSP